MLAGWWLGAGDPITAVPALRLRRLGTLCVAALAAAHLAHPWFVASSMGGSTQFGETLALVPTVLSSTRQGALWYAGSAALVVLLGAVFFVSPRRPSIAAAMEVAALCAVAAAKAASGHASGNGDFTLAETAQFLHLLATAVWAGAIIVSGLIVAPHLAARAGAKDLWSYGNRLSRAVTWALGVLIVSGLYASWNDMHGTLNILWTSPWGKVLLAKLAFVGLAVLLGCLNRFRCLGCPATSEKAATMTRLLRSEAVVMIVILWLSGLLANSNPGA